MEVFLGETVLAAFLSSSPSQERSIGREYRTAFALVASISMDRSWAFPLSPKFQFLLPTMTLFFWANSLWFWFCGVFGTRLRTATQRNCDNYHLPPTTTLQQQQQQREATCTQSVLCHKPRGCRTGRGSGRCYSSRGNGSVCRRSRPSGPSSPVNDCRSSNATRSRP